MSKPDYIARFELVGELYYRRFHRLRPGKDEPPASYRNANTDENRAQFDAWAVNHLFTDLLDYTLKLEARLEEQSE